MFFTFICEWFLFEWSNVIGLLLFTVHIQPTRNWDEYVSLFAFVNRKKHCASIISSVFQEMLKKSALIGRERIPT